MPRGEETPRRHGPELDPVIPLDSAEVSADVSVGVSAGVSTDEERRLIASD